MYKFGPNDKLTGSPICIFNLDTNTSIPFDPDNVDFQQYQKWVAEGNLPRPADFVEPSSESSVEPLPADTMENT